MPPYSSSCVGFKIKKHAELLSGLAVEGMEYYINNTHDQDDMTASINNNVYKIKFEAVSNSNKQTATL